MSNSVQLVPNAADLAKSIRGLGYTPASAIADLIDNSISAGAKIVSITFAWNGGDPRLLLLDDGAGMSAETLTEAMRLGGDPDKPRAASDLGRFGLGLKTASFSQARTLIVASKTSAAEPAAVLWDIDHITDTNSWDLQLGAGSASADVDTVLGPLPRGTLVIWQRLDLMFGAGEKSVDLFLQIAETTADHLGMTYHRLIEGGRLEITINGSVVRAWDPFASSDPNCKKYPPVKIEPGAGRGEATFVGCILPPPAVLTAEQQELYGGPNGWTAQQGFYVYRADRIVVSGGWLNLGRAGKSWRPDRDHMLARISLDISNSSDTDWVLDIRKSTLTAPQDFRPQLLRNAQELRKLAKATLTARRRGRSVAGGDSEEPLPSVWISERAGAFVRFRIDRRHPLIASARRASSEATQLRTLLDRIDADLPLQPNLPAEAAQVAATVQLAQIADVIRLAKGLYYSLRKGSNLSPSEARQRLNAIPQFREHETVVILALESYEMELQKVPQ